MTSVWDVSWGGGGERIRKLLVDKEDNIRDRDFMVAKYIRGLNRKENWFRNFIYL